MNNGAVPRSLVWRLAIPVFILVVSTICLEAGVNVQYRPHIADEGFLMHVLHAMSLFKVNGINLGLPISGPIWARDLLILTYFAAPAVSISAIVEALFRVSRFKLRWILLRGGHAVIIGAGRASSDLSAIIGMEVMRKRWHRLSEVGVSTVIVDKSEDALIRNSGPMLKMQLDASDPLLVETLNLRNARIVMILTDDDQANIDLYFRLRDRLASVPERKQPQVFIRVRDMDLMRVLRTYNTTVKTRFFNVHIEAVRSLFALERTVAGSAWLTRQRSMSTSLSANWDALARVKDLHPECIVFLGFGRFGQHLLTELLNRDDGMVLDRLTSLVVVSPDVEKEWAHFERLLLCNIASERSLPEPQLICGTHQDVDTLHSVARGSVGKETLFILGTDDVPANIQAASVIQRFCSPLSGDYPGHTTIVVRTNVFSMAHDRLLHSGKSPHVDHVILPAYHVLGAYFSRRLRDGVT